MFLARFIAASLFACCLPGLQARESALDFATWLEGLRAEARDRGISEATLLTLDAIQPLERVLELDNSQPEFVQTFTRYLDLRITPRQISQGQALLRQYGVLLEEVQRRYGVQPHYLVAFWAIESNYGKATGGFSVLEALATLAYDPRRAVFFREQLLVALQIIDDGHIPAERMSGSWAGAMGQLQFMPNIFYQYGVDGDADGRVDIWNSLPDIFHSAANFLSKSGWRGDERWGREVMLPDGFDYSLTGTATRMALERWQSLGLTLVNGDPLPVVAGMEASVILPAGAQGPAFLGYQNFRATMTYNPSTFYALTVGHLADRFMGGDAIARMPKDEQAMSVADVKQLQELLNSRGFASGEPDGRVGRQTRAAIRAYQKSHGLPQDGHASRVLFESLQN